MQEDKAEVEGKWTERFGGSGGGPNEFMGANYTLVSVRGRVGSYIDQFIFTFRDITTGK